MRVLVLNQYFAPDRSATAQLLTELCEDLTAAGHDVHALVGRPSYNPEARTKSRGLLSHESHGKVRVTRVWSTAFHREGMGGRLANYASYLTTSALGILTLERPDVVLAWTDPPPVGLVGALTPRLRRVPLVVTMQDVFPEVALRLGMLASPVAIWAMRAMRNTIIRRGSRVVAVGRDQRSRLLSLGVPDVKVEIIPNWMDGRLTRPLQGMSALRRQLGWEDRFVVMHSGNIGLSQDLDTVLDAADRLRGEQKIVFAIAGDGASKHRLEQDARRRALNNVRFLPYQPKASLGESLGLADIHLIALRRGLAGYIVPSKLYGVMAAGKPFIASVEPGSEPALIAAEHQCGIRVDPGDALALTSAILRCREAPITDMGRRARSAFERLYDRPIATRAYERLLQEVSKDR